MRRGRGNSVPVAATAAELVPNLSVAEPRVRLGDVLVQSGAVTREAVETAAQARDVGRIGAVLIERGLLDEYAVTMDSLAITALRPRHTEELLREAIKSLR